MQLVTELTLKNMGWRKRLGLTLIFLGIGLALVTVIKEIVDLSAIPFNRRLLLLVLALVVSVVMHEGLHGVFFKKFTGKVQFGFKGKTAVGPVFYASSIGSMIPRVKYQIIGLAPQIGTVILLGILFIAPLRNDMWWFISCLLLLNFIGSAIDIYVVFWLRKFPKSVMIEDSMTGLKIWQV